MGGKIFHGLNLSHGLVQAVDFCGEILLYEVLVTLKLGRGVAAHVLVVV